MNLNSLDLNLLVALDALLREANVSRAAMRIGLSQPAASHALQRLRDLIGDPLLVRTGARMELTPRAQALRAPLAQALDQVRSLFIPDDFDAARSERQFRLMMPDLAVELLMPPLMEKITRVAPNVRIDVVPWRGPAIFTAEFARTIDLVISIGNAFTRISPATALHRQRCARGPARPSRRRPAEAARNVSRRAPCRGRDPRPERGPDRRLVALQGHRAADRAGRARLHRGAARHRAHRSRRLRAAPPDRRTVEAIVARNDRAAARSRDRRAVHVLPDPRPDGPRLDLAAQHHARHRPRDGAGEEGARTA